MITFNYQNTSERDIDRIICEELYCSQEFFELFLAKVNRSGATICNIEHSKRDTTMGETDIEVIYDFEGNKYGMLIEDKITAKKQDMQPERYRLRGDNGVKAGDYCGYHTFMVAPQSYINNPLNDADKYDHWVTHDEIADYFKKSRDSHSEFRMRCFDSSLQKHRYSSQNMKMEHVADFFVKYAGVLESCDFENVHINKMPNENSGSGWVQFASFIPNTRIMHKCKNADKDSKIKGAVSGFVELHFPRIKKEDFHTFENTVTPYIERNTVLFGKAKPMLIGSQVAIRMKVCPILINQSVYDQKDNLKKVFKAISDIYNLSKTLSTVAI